MSLPRTPSVLFACATLVMTTRASKPKQRRVANAVCTACVVRRLLRQTSKIDAPSCCVVILSACRARRAVGRLQFSRRTRRRTSARTTSVNNSSSTADVQRPSSPRCCTTRFQIHHVCHCLTTYPKHLMSRLQQGSWNVFGSVSAAKLGVKTEPVTFYVQEFLACWREPCMIMNNTRLNLTAASLRVDVRLRRHAACTTRSRLGRTCPWQTRPPWSWLQRSTAAC